MQEFQKTFNHLKIHTQYSICEGAIKIDDLKNFCKENKILAKAKRDDATDKGNEPPAKLFFTIGLQGKSKFHDVLTLEVRYKGTFSPWPQFLGEMSDDFIKALKSAPKQKQFTSDCGKK